MLNSRKKVIVNRAIAQLQTVMQSQTVNPIYNRSEELLISASKIKAILTILIEELLQMQQCTEFDSSNTLMQKIADCIDGNGCKIEKNEELQCSEVERSFTYNINDDSVIVNIHTNTTLANGTDDQEGLCESGATKTVKQAVRLTIKDHRLKHQFIARGNIELSQLDDDCMLVMRAYESNIEKILRDVSISKRYKSPFIVETDCGVEYNHLIYFDKITKRKISKKGTVAQNSDNIIPIRTRAIYTYSPQALGSLEQLDRFLTPQQIVVKSNDLRDFRIPTIFHKLLNDILEGLAVMHARGDVHGDVKFDNILLYRNEDQTLTAKLCDFDLSTLSEDSPEQKRLRIEGTKEYSSPQITKHLYKKYDYKPDEVWSLGDLRCAEEPIEDISENHAKHDMWSVGQILFSFLINKIPNFNPDRNNAYVSILNQHMLEHPVLKALLATDMNQRPTAKEAQKLLRLDYLLTTNDSLQYSEEDLELLYEHQKSLTMRSYCCGLFHRTPKNPNPHNSLKLVNNKILDLKAKQAAATRNTVRHSPRLLA